VADPPVVYPEGRRDGSPWRALPGSFSLTAWEMVLYEAIFADAVGRNDNRALDEADTARLDEQYERLPFPDYPGLVATRGPAGHPLDRRTRRPASEDSRTWL
jgi:hypothetical protein